MIGRWEESDVEHNGGMKQFPVECGVARLSLWSGYFFAEGVKFFTAGLPPLGKIPLR
jgi:hypothetical protein